MVEGSLALEFATRVTTTAAIVILLTKVTSWAGPKLGGTVAGLPIVVGPGFYFMIERGSGAFLADAAIYALYALSAAQVFLLAYVYSAGSFSAPASLATAALTWLFVAPLLHFVPPNFVFGLALYVVVTLGVRRLAKSRIVADTAIRRLENPWVLLLRGGLAGLLVGTVTLAASALGSSWSGMLVSFPIAFSVISVTVHEMLGRAAVIALLYAAMPGTASLAAFCTGMAVLAPRVSPYLALGGALLLSVAVTSLLAAWVRFASSGSGAPWRDGSAG